MSEVDDIDLDVVLRRIDELMKEVRRQGRASIAAQAAAESCLESVSTLQEQMRESAAAQDPPDNDDREAVVRALLPFVDALDRTAEHACSLAESTPRPSAIARWLGVPDTSPGLVSMRDGTRLLRAQLEDILGQWDVRVERSVGIPVDPTIHRVVDTCAMGDDQQPETVVAVVRPAVFLNDWLLREADVIASRKG